MKIYGLYKVINISNKNCDSFDLFNQLHPHQKLHNIDFYLSSIGGLKTFLNFFYEDDIYASYMDANQQYVKYLKYKRDLELAISSKQKTEYELDLISKMALRIIDAENKYIKYKQQIIKLEQLQEENKKILDQLQNNQSQYAKNIDTYINLLYSHIKITDQTENLLLTKLFDLDNISPIQYPDTILFPQSSISFFRTAINHNNGLITLDDDKRVEYIVFELESEAEIMIKKCGNEDTIKKIEQIIKLCSEINISIPENMSDQFSDLVTKPKKIILGDKHLYIYCVNENDKILELSLITNLR